MMWSDPTEADWLAALGNAHRIEVLRHLLTTRTATPSEIADANEVALGTVSHHIRFLARRGIVQVAGSTRRHRASVRHYQLADRERVVSVLWGMRARLLVTDIERNHGRSNVTVFLDAEALGHADRLTADYLARLSELGLQARERGNAKHGHAPDELTGFVVLLTTDRDP